MSDNDLMELHKQHRTGQDKYSYFLLAVAASGIAFSIEKTSGLNLSWSMLPLGLAVIMWALSFYFGCKSLYWIQSSILANYSLLQLYKGVHSTQPNDPQVLNAAIKGVTKAFDSNVSKATFYDRWQFYLLIIGAVGFIAWHITEMIIRTYMP
jgi:hypothetical protein